MKVSWHLGEVVNVQDMGEPGARSAEGLARRLGHIAPHGAPSCPAPAHVLCSLLKHTDVEESCLCENSCPSNLQGGPCRKFCKAQPYPAKSWLSCRYAKHTYGQEAHHDAEYACIDALALLCFSKVFRCGKYDCIRVLRPPGAGSR